ncbi:MAG: histidinol dehydrogenase [Armatimonadetes bacterium]|nr:histidinol dehydrogenase [Armatimonadota bacterium]MBS1726130.1 histidinol dehydrogenase [Armatimonadota bacterium]
MIPLIRWSQADDATKTRVLRRAQASFAQIEGDVRHWIGQVQTRGDQAILDYIRHFDQRDGRIGKFAVAEFGVHNFRVTDLDREHAYDTIDGDLLLSIRHQVELSRKFHEAYAANLPSRFEIEQAPGVVAGYRRLPVASAGLYVPAGKAPLPTVAQILTVAARSAGVPRTVVCFPPTNEVSETAILVAATEAGADEIYRVGGIAAIAALAYGTETIQPVDVIAGPGNPWVQAAKLAVSGQVGIDMIAGPSEAMIVADELAKPEYVAADILAQCEHGSDSAGVLATTSMAFAEAVKTAIERQLVGLDRQGYLAKSLSQFSALIVVDSDDALIDLVNEYAPEHLEIQTADPDGFFAQVRNAGSCFLGGDSPIAAGDYATGTNHTLPTGTATRYASAVSPETFIKTIQYQRLSKDGLAELKPIVEHVSDAEGLDAHKRSVQIRFEG